jgi:hypothetical protein
MSHVVIHQTDSAERQSWPIAVSPMICPHRAAAKARLTQLMLSAMARIAAVSGAFVGPTVPARGFGLAAPTQ